MSQTLANMPIPQVILIIIVVCIGAGALVRLIIKKHGTDPETTPFDYLLVIADSVRDTMEDCLKVCAIKPEDFKTSEEYMKALIRFGIMYLKQNATDIGIKVEYLNMIDQEILENFMYNIISQFLVKVEPVYIKP